MDPRPVDGAPESAELRLAVSVASPPATMSLAERVMGTTCVGFLAALGGMAIGAHGANDAHTSGGRLLLWVLLEVAVLVATVALAGVAVLGVVAFTAFAVVTGITLAPIVHGMAVNGQGAVVAQAFLGTAAITLALTAYARVTTRDFAGATPYLLAGLVGLVLMSVLQVVFASPLLNLVLGMAAVLLFSAFLIHDVQRATRSVNTRGNAVRIALSVYLDIGNLFLSLLRVGGGRSQ